MKAKFIITIFVLALFSFTGALAGPSQENGQMEDALTYDIGIFVPGVVAGSPVYEQLVAGAERAVSESEHTTVKILEGGFNQGEWEEKMMSMAASNEYELILTSNGAMPFIALPVAEAFPQVKFLIVDAIFEGHQQMFTVLYNQVEQAAMIGYLAGLVTKSSMPGASPDLKIGMIVGQEYPAMNEMIAPGFEYGATKVDPSITVDMRVLGNWYDANKAAELANSMMDAGVDIILTICGGANQGVITAAEARGRYVLYFDEENYGLAPGTILGCSALMQEQAVYEYVTDAIAGRIEWGSSRILGTAEGYVDFVDDHPLYRDSVPGEIRAEMQRMLDAVRTGEISLEVPRYW